MDQDKGYLLQKFYGSVELLLVELCDALRRLHLVGSRGEKSAGRGSCTCSCTGLGKMVQNGMTSHAEPRLSTKSLEGFCSLDPTVVSKKKE